MFPTNSVSGNAIEIRKDVHATIAIRLRVTQLPIQLKNDGGNLSPIPVGLVLANHAAWVMIALFRVREDR